MQGCYWREQVTSPTQRSLAALRKDGWTCEIVEHWNSFSRTRRDLFGGLDILAIRDGETLGVQTTSGTNVSARLAKIKAEPRLAQWLRAGNRLMVHGWRKVGARGAVKKWECRVEEVTLEALT